MVHTAACLIALLVAAGPVVSTMCPSWCDQPRASEQAGCQHDRTASVGAATAHPCAAELTTPALPPESARELLSAPDAAVVTPVTGTVSRASLAGQLVGPHQHRAASWCSLTVLRL